MGAVYLAVDPLIGRKVALKLLREGLETPELRERFNREARSAGRLNHRNVVVIFDVGEQDGRPYIAMEYVEGRTLHDMIRQRDALPLLNKLQFMEQLCDGLAYAHRAGVVHRDVKPANLIVDQEGVLKILDFGIARIGQSSQTMTGMVMGTLSYMSPEQISGAPNVDHRCDIFAVGAVFYEFLSYSRAFPGELHDGLLHRILVETPPALESRCPGIDPAIETIVMRALEKDPGRRYQNLDLMRTDIARAREAQSQAPRQGSSADLGAGGGVGNATGGRPADAAGALVSGPPWVRSGAPGSAASAARSAREEVARFRSQQIDLWLTEARTRMDARSYDGVLEACQQIFVLDPDNRAGIELSNQARAEIDRRFVTDLLGRALEALGKSAFAEASSLVGQALAVDPGSSDALRMKLRIDDARRKTEQRQLRECEIANALAEARSAAGRGELEAALRAVDAVFALDPESREGNALREQTLKALDEQRKQRELADLAVSVADEAQKRFDAGETTEAVLMLECFRPQLPVVAERLALLTRKTEERRRQEEEEARRREAEAPRRRQAIEVGRPAAEGAWGPGGDAVPDFKAREVPAVSALPPESGSGPAQPGGPKTIPSLDGGAAVGMETIRAPRESLQLPDGRAPRPPVDVTMFISASRRGADGVAEFEAVLEVESSPDLRNVRKSVPVPSGVFEIGRQAAGLSLDDPHLSERHARIEKLNGGYYLVDLESRNGTTVNGARVDAEGIELPLGARIQVGSSVLIFRNATSAPLPLPNGYTIEGRFVLGEVLRRNATSVVYEGHDTRFGSRVAVKILSPDRARSRLDRERFERDARVSGHLQHSNICRPRDWGYVHVPAAGKPAIETVYIVSDLLEGGTLAERLGGAEPIPLVQAVAWTKELGSGLDYAHDRGVVHGDLKPSAVLFDGRSRPHVTDFSVARQATDPEPTPIFGSPAYMAPEQWLGETTPASDQFALAALAYYMVTGVPPFEGQENPRIRKRNFEVGPEPAHILAAEYGRPGVPGAVSDVLQKALSVKWADRYGSLAEFTHAFEEAAAGRLAPPSGKVRPRVFLSYHRDCSEGWADAVELRLKKNFRVFLDRHRLDAAGPFPEKLAREIQACDVFVCLLGDVSLRRKWVRYEVALAHQNGKPMIPVFQADYRPPAEEELDDPIRALVDSDGVELKGEYSNEAYAKLARMIRKTSASRPSNRRPRA